ncbi:hypothetical protein QYF36_007267 [Acer negundo]|nr:hypothetical protein QYF36_007267 [Acer negundo]
MNSRNDFIYPSSHESASQDIDSTFGFIILPSTGPGNGGSGNRSLFGVSKRKRHALASSRISREDLKPEASLFQPLDMEKKN